jgi:hypothetical protein
MKIAEADYGYRSLPAVDQPQYWTNYSAVMDGTMAAVNLGRRIHDIPIVFRNMSDTNKSALKWTLDAVLPGGTVAIEPDTGDDMQIGISSETNFIFLSFSAEVAATGPLWDVTILVRYVA